MDVAARERDLYGDVFSSVPKYSDFSPGEARVPMFMEMAGVDAAATFKGSALDAGTGSGKGAVALAAHGFRVTACDLDDYRADEARALTIPFARACLWDDLRPLGWFDYAYCCDVMEHVPPEFTMLVVARLLAVSRRGAFFSISLVPDAFGAWVGRPLHQTVRPFTWWRDNLRSLGDVVECRDLRTTGVYYVAPRASGC